MSLFFCNFATHFELSSESYLTWYIKGIII